MRGKINKILIKGIWAWRKSTAPFRGGPDYLVLGTQRGGTTTLHHLLSKHPHMVPTLGKELHYFDIHFNKGETFYRAHFPFSWELGTDKRTGDNSPYYIIHPLAPERAAAYKQDLKLICLLRHPVQRAYSHYQHSVRKGYENEPSFAEAVRREPERLAGEYEKLQADPQYISRAFRNFSYLTRGKYIEQLQRWLQYFPHQQFLIIFSESFFANSQKTIDTISDFLNVPRWTLPRVEIYNQEAYPPLSGIDQEKLNQYFEPYNAALADQFDLELPWTS